MGVDTEIIIIAYGFLVDNSEKIHNDICENFKFYEYMKDINNTNNL